MEINDHCVTYFRESLRTFGGNSFSEVVSDNPLGFCLHYSFIWQTLQERAKVAFCQVPVQMISCFMLAEGKFVMFYCISHRIKINTVAGFSLCVPHQVESSGGPPGSSGPGFTQSSWRERRSEVSVQG